MNDDHGEGNGRPQPFLFYWAGIVVAGLSIYLVIRGGTQVLGLRGLLAAVLALSSVALFWGAVHQPLARRQVHRVLGCVTLMAAGLVGITLLSSRGIAGEVSCASGRPVVGVWVVAMSSPSGFATHTPVGRSIQDFTYTLRRGGNYLLHVGCGGSRNQWATTNSSPQLAGTPHRLICFDTPTSASGHASKLKTCSIGSSTP